MADANEKSPPPTDGITSKQDTEKQPPLPESSPHLVTWHGDDDPDNPLNWSSSRKWAITILISFSGLIILTSTTMLAPALATIAADFDISQASANMAMSIFTLAFAFGPMLLAPFTEVFGRRNVWLICGLWDAAWCVVSGFAGNVLLLLVSRLMAGFGSSADFAVNNPVLGDIWAPEQRGQSFAIATFLPLLGPAIGPLAGGAITSTIGWRWCFWVLGVANALLMAVGYFVLPETYSILILQRRAAKLTKQTGTQHYTDLNARIQPLGSKLYKAILRPTRLLATQPIIQLMSLFLAFNYGLLFFVLTSYSLLWTTQYHESVLDSSFHYIAIVIGYTIASQGGAPLTDRIWRHLKARSNGQTKPEYRVPLMLPGNLFILAGLLWIGWAAATRAQWALVDAGAVVYGCGTILSTQAMQQYVMECFPDYVASASAASQLLRGIFAFVFPLFAPALYNRLGYGWGNTTLALVFLLLAAGGPGLLWFYGEKLRSRGRVVL